MKGGGAATWVLAFAPLLLVAYGVQSLWSVWREPGLDPASAPGWAPVVAETLALLAYRLGAFR